MSGYQMYQEALSNRYASTRIETTVVALYDGMLNKLRQAQDHFDKSDEVSARACVIRAMRIVDALMDNLDLDGGGEAARNLERLYAYMISELSQIATTSNTRESLPKVIETAETLRSAWKRLEEQGR